MKATLYGQGVPEPLAVSLQWLRLICPTSVRVLEPSATAGYHPHVRTSAVDGATARLRNAQSGGTVFAPLPWGANTEAPAHGPDPTEAGPSLAVVLEQSALRVGGRL